MVYNCCVIGCKSASRRGVLKEKTNFRFSRIPKSRTSHTCELSAKRRHAWLRAINREVTPNFRVCSRHFVTGEPAQIKDTLHIDWIPTQNMGSSCKLTPRKSIESLRRYYRSRDRAIKKTAPATEIPPDTEFVTPTESLVSDPSHSTLAGKKFKLAINSSAVSNVMYNSGETFKLIGYPGESNPVNTEQIISKLKKSSLLNVQRGQFLNKICLVDHCMHLSQHFFPTDVNYKQIWIVKLNLFDRSINEKSRVCSQHFSPDQLNSQNDLKINAVPDQNLPTLKKYPAQTDNDPSNWITVTSSTIPNLSIKIPNGVILQTTDEVQSLPEDDDICNTNECFMEDSSPKLKILPNIILPVPTKFEINVIQTESNLEIMTYLRKFSSLDDLERVYLTVQSSISCEISVRECILLALIKLKQNIEFSMLGVFFMITEERTKKIFNESLAILKTILKPVIQWPKKDEIVSEMLASKKMHFLDARAVLDFISIQFDAPNSVTITNIYKFLIAVKPADGRLIYISRAYSKLMGDKTIFQNIKLIEKIKAENMLNGYQSTGDAFILPERGLPIDSLVSEHSIKIYRPLCDNGAKKAEIAYCTAARNQENRLIEMELQLANNFVGNMREFKIVSDKLNSKLFNFIENAVFAVAGIVNYVKFEQPLDSK